MKTAAARSPTVVHAAFSTTPRKRGGNRGETEGCRGRYDQEDQPGARLSPSACECRSARDGEGCERRLAGVEAPNALDHEPSAVRDALDVGRAS